MVIVTGVPVGRAVVPHQLSRLVARSGIQDVSTLPSVPAAQSAANQQTTRE